MGVMPKEKKGEDRAEADELAALIDAADRGFRQVDDARTNMLYFMHGSEGARQLIREGSKALGHEKWYGLFQRICSVWKQCPNVPFVRLVIERLLRMAIEDLEQLLRVKNYEEARLYDETLERLLFVRPSSRDFCSGLTAADLAPVCGERFSGYLERFTQAHAALSTFDQSPAPAPPSASNGASAPSHAQA